MFSDSFGKIHKIIKQHRIVLLRLCLRETKTDVFLFKPKKKQQKIKETTKKNFRDTTEMSRNINFTYLYRS